MIETERLIITGFTPDMAQAVWENSMDEDNKRFVPDEVWETAEETEKILKLLISRYGTDNGPLVYPVIVKETRHRTENCEKRVEENGMNAACGHKNELTCTGVHTGTAPDGGDCRYCRVNGKRQTVNGEPVDRVPGEEHR